MAGDNKQRQGSPSGLLDTNTSQDRQKSNNRIPDKFTSIDQKKIGVSGVKTWKRPARIPHANDDGGRLYDTNGL